MKFSDCAIFIQDHFRDSKLICANNVHKEWSFSFVVEEKGL